MQFLFPKQIPYAEAGHVSYEIQWVIPNWRHLRSFRLDRIEKQKAIFETGQQPAHKFQTKWLLGLRRVPLTHGQIGTSQRFVRLYWQLLNLEGPETILKLEAKLVTRLCGGGARDVDGPPPRVQEYQGISMGDIVEENGEYLVVYGNDAYRHVVCETINSDGAVQFSLVLTFKTAGLDSACSGCFQTGQFVKQSHDQLRENLGTLLNDNSKGDLRIETSDGVELTAHQVILKARCPVFARMLNCDFSESQTGILRLDDLTGKTMKILLRYFYTGDLQDGWRDGDTIVEFVYAAGKYEMTNVLNLLDNMLGICVQDEVSNLDVQLLDLTAKLSMKNAEERLLRRIIANVSAVKSSTELFHLFGYDREEIARKAELLAGEKVLEILDDLLGCRIEENDMSRRGMRLLCLVQRNGLKTMEKNFTPKIC